MQPPSYNEANLSGEKGLLVAVISLAVIDANRPLSGRGSAPLDDPEATSAMLFLFKRNQTFDYYCDLMGLSGPAFSKALLLDPRYPNIRRRYRYLKYHGYFKDLKYDNLLAQLNQILHDDSQEN